MYLFFKAFKLSLSLSLMATQPPPSSSLENEDARGGEQAPGPDGNQLAMPEDGYEWKKYGQKYIRSISKNRSYFKCRRNGCRVKKRVDWPPNDPSNMRIVYKGVHNHQPRATTSDQEASGSSSALNPYDLRTQVLGQPDEHL